MQDYLEDAHEYWGFEGAAAVAYDGQVLLSRGYGLANQNVSERNSPQTKFMIGSVTKQFTASAILVLEEQGKLRLQDPISRHLPDFPADKAERITIHHLLTHTSGLWEYSSDPEVLLRRTQPFDPDGLVARIAREPLQFSPGSRFSYSNSGYVVLGAIIEAVSGQSYEAFLHHALFAPAGMTSTGYARREAGLPNRADGYTQGPAGGLIDALPIHFSVLHSAGALYSTVEDMLKWNQALNSETVLSRRSIQRMFTPAVRGYALGWMMDTRYGHRYAHHNGFMDGYNCTYERWLDDRLCIVVFSNDDDAPVEKIAHGLAAILFRQPYDRPERKTAVQLSPGRLKEYEGVFQLPGENQYQVVVFDNDSLFTYRYGEPRELLLAAAPDSLYYSIDNTHTVTFLRDKFDVVTGIDLYDNGQTTTAYLAEPETARVIACRRTPVRVSAAQLLRLDGTYALQSLPGKPFQLTVAAAGDRLLVQASGTGPIELWPASDSVFFDPNGDLTLIFRFVSGEQATECILRMGNESTRAVLTE